MSFKPSRLERATQKVDECQKLVDHLAALGNSLAGCIKAWKWLFVGIINLVTWTTGVDGHLFRLLSALI